MTKIVVFLVAYIATKFINERALTRLSADEKVRLLDGFSTHRKFGALAIIAGCVLAGVAANSLSDGPAADAIFWAIVVSIFVGYFIQIDRTIGRLELPPDYRRSSRIGAALLCSAFLGMVVLSVLEARYPDAGHPLPSDAVNDGGENES